MFMLLLAFEVYRMGIRSASVRVSLHLCVHTFKQDYLWKQLAECRVQFSGNCDLDLWPSFKNIHVRNISLILFEVGIPNLVCACILGWQSVAYHTWVTVDLTSDLVSRIAIDSGAYPIFFEIGIPIWCIYASWDGWVSHTIFGSLWPWPWSLTLYLD